MIQDLYGWRARIGLIYMASSINMEPEFYMMAPKGISIHTTRIILPKVTVKGLTEMAESPEVQRCTELLGTAPLNVIIFGGTSASFIKGYGWDLQIINRMQKISKGIPVTTTSTEVIKALKALNLTKIAFATPYTSEVNEQGRNFLESNGFKVVSEKGLGLEEDHDIGYVGLEAVYDLVKAVDTPEAEGVFISCTNLRTIDTIDTLEKDLKKPVVSAIQASFWGCLRISRVFESIEGFGRLLTI